MKQHELRFITLYAMAQLNALGGMTPNSLRVTHSKSRATYCGSLIGPLLSEKLHINLASASKGRCTLGGLIIADGRIYGISAGQGFQGQTRASSQQDVSSKRLNMYHVSQQQIETDAAYSSQIFEEVEDVARTAPLTTIHIDQPSDMSSAALGRYRSVEASSKSVSVVLRQTSSRTKELLNPQPGVSDDSSSTGCWDWALIQLSPNHPPPTILPNRDGYGNSIEGTADVPELTQKISVLVSDGQNPEGTLYPLPVSVNLGIQVYSAYRISLQVRLLPGFSGA